MEIKFLFVILVTIKFSIELDSYNSTIIFSSNGIKTSGEEGVVISGTTAIINKSGDYLITGSSTQGNIIIEESSMNIYLENLELTSSTTAPIIVNSNLNNIKIISVENVVLKDLEDSSTTIGECAVIKVKEYSSIIFENKKDFTLNGNCKNVIKGGAQASIEFDSSNGEYTINAYQNGIASDGLLTFNGGKFTVITKTGDAIKSSPDDGDNKSLGKIIINNGLFNIQSYCDAFQAKNNIIITTGSFDIKTENGYESTTFDKDNGSAKGFKVSNNVTGCCIKVFGGTFSLNTADNAFHSNGNLTLFDGNYKIYSKYDGLHSGYHVLIGKSELSITPNINVFNSYEAIEGKSIRIYSGKLNVTATDDGINAAGGSSGSDDQPTPGPGPNPGPHSKKRKAMINEPGPAPSGGGDSNYFISIFGGEINVYCDGDGMDSNGDVYFHGGDINVFSQGNKDNEPIDHDGDFTLFGATVLCVGAKGMEYVHEGILKGDQMYAYYTGSINKNKLLIVKDKNNKVVKQGYITKDVNYIFYTSSDLNKNYKFYISDYNGSNQKEYTFSFGKPASGSDDKDNKADEGGDFNNNSSKVKTILIISISISIAIILIIILIVVFYKKKQNKNNNNNNKEDSLIVNTN